MIYCFDSILYDAINFAGKIHWGQALRPEIYVRLSYCMGCDGRMNWILMIIFINYL